MKDNQEAESEGSLVFGACATPSGDRETILLGHGSGGRLSAELLRDVFLPEFRNETLSRLEDQASVSIRTSRVALTTDAFVVKPIFFPGGDIGRLAVCGTVNDLAVGGARPRFIAASFILEEGLSTASLRRVVRSMREACAESGVELVTGDTKVVDRGKGDEIFITTTGLGEVPAGRDLSVSYARPGDRVIVSGTLGDHGIAILSVREGLAFETAIETDSAPLTEPIEALLAACPTVRCLRDPTRGGLSSTLHEIAEASGVSIMLTETAIPLRREVRAACEMLGLDPLYVANEGKFVAIVPPDGVDRALDALRGHRLARNAAVIGEVRAGGPLVSVMSAFGGERIVSQLAGEQLPRIC